MWSKVVCNWNDTDVNSKSTYSVNSTFYCSIHKENMKQSPRQLGSQRVCRELKFQNAIMCHYISQ